jgi:imidazolonepropionase-like amidohydrolase
VDWTPEPPRTPLEIAQNGAGKYAITGATVHPVSSAPIANGVVLIDGGKILSVGADVAVPGDYTVVEAAGLHVYPGLIDADTELGLIEIPRIEATNDSRELAMFQPDIKSVSAVNPHSSHIGVSLCEGITTAAVLPDGGVVSGSAGMIQLDGWTMPEMLRDDAIGLVVSLPSLPTEIDDEDRKDRIKRHRETVEEIETFVKDAQHYAKVRALAETDRRVELPMNVKLEAMIPYVRGEKPVMFRADSYKEILEAVKFADTFELKPIIVGGADAWKCADMLAEKSVPVIVNSVYGYPFTDHTPFDAQFGNPGMLEDAGVPFCIATGSSEYSRRLALHAGIAVAYGLSPERALAACTLDAAKILGKADEVGSLEAGKVADVIVSSGEFGQASSRTVAAFIAGEPVELTSKHEESYQRFSNRPVPDLPPPPDNMNGPAPMRVE